LERWPLPGPRVFPKGVWLPENLPPNFPEAPKKRGGKKMWNLSNLPHLNGPPGNGRI